MQILFIAVLLDRNHRRLVAAGVDDPDTDQAAGIMKTSGGMRHGNRFSIPVKGHPPHAISTPGPPVRGDAAAPAGAGDFLPLGGKDYTDDAYELFALHVALTHNHLFTIMEAEVSTIIAGRFQQQASVDEATEELVRAGFARESIASFFVNPPGQHDTYPIGGDHDESPGAHSSRKGVVKGAATGAVVGAAATSFLGPVGTVTGALLGAHVGGLVGSLSEMKERGETGEQGEDLDNAMPLRHSGMLLAVAIGDNQDEGDAVQLLRSLGAEDIERAQGTIVNGDWTDFDPVSTPVLLRPPADLPQAPTPSRRL